MLSSRSALPTTPNLLAAALEHARARGRRIVDLTESNPTLAGIPFDAPAILGALSDPGSLRYDPEPFGLPSARQAVAVELSKQGTPIVADRIVLTASTSEAYGLLFKLLCDPGDEVVVPEPSYPLLQQLAAFECVRLVPYRLAYDGAWHVDTASLRGALSARSRAVVVVSPNNPTGSFVKKDELVALAAAGLPIISDEVFAGYAFGADARRAGSALEATDALVFALGGLSKHAALPQLKLAWIAAGGPSPLVRAALDRLEHLADAYLSAATPVQLALPSLLASRSVAVEAIRRRTARNLARLREQSGGCPVSVLDVEGGWYAVVRLPATEPEEAWVLGLLEEDGVLVQPGWFYDFREEPIAVVSLLAREADFDAGVAGLLERVRRRS